MIMSHLENDAFSKEEKNIYTYLEYTMTINLQITKSY